MEDYRVYGRIDVWGTMDSSDVGIPQEQETSSTHTFLVYEYSWKLDVAYLLYAWEE